MLGGLHKRDDPRCRGLSDPASSHEVIMPGQTTNGLSRKQVLALLGLRLPSAAMKQLQQTGIHSEPSISIEHQHLARKYVIRGVESGGAIPQLGHYVGFVDANGEWLSWLHRIHTVGRNGLHAVAVAPHLVRLQMFRSEQTYDLLITQHQLEVAAEGRRPAMRNRILFHGIQGTLALELWGKDSRFSDQVAPVFYTRSGEPLLIPDMFREAVCRITAAACCIGCQHCHLLQPKSIERNNDQPAGDL
jgi:hypothetical protein